MADSSQAVAAPVMPSIDEMFRFTKRGRRTGVPLTRFLRLEGDNEEPSGEATTAAKIARLVQYKQSSLGEVKPCGGGDIDVVDVKVGHIAEVEGVAQLKLIIGTPPRKIEVEGKLADLEVFAKRLLELHAQPLRSEQSVDGDGKARHDTPAPIVKAEIVRSPERDSYSSETPLPEEDETSVPVTPTRELELEVPNAQQEVEQPSVLTLIADAVASMLVAATSAAEEPKKEEATEPAALPEVQPVCGQAMGEEPAAYECTIQSPPMEEEPAAAANESALQSPPMKECAASPIEEERLPNEEAPTAPEPAETAAPSVTEPPKETLLALPVTSSTPINSSEDGSPTDRSPAHSSTPIDKSKWVPDEDAPACQLCDKPFTAMFRRHHCRLCGKVICGNCSSHNKMNSKSIRVCRTCAGASL